MNTVARRACAPRAFSLLGTQGTHLCAGLAASRKRENDKNEGEQRMTSCVRETMD